MVVSTTKKKTIYENAVMVYRGLRAYKKKIGILVILGFVSSLLEGIGINAIIPLFSFLSGGHGGEDIISTSIQKAFASVGIPFTFRYLLLFVALLFILRAVALIVSNYVKITATTAYEEKMRGSLFRSALVASWAYLLHQRLGHLETTIMTNVQYGELLLSHIASALILMASLLVYLVVAINISVVATIATVILGALLFVAFNPIVMQTKRAATTIEAINKEVAHHINENVLGMKTVKIMQVAPSVIERGLAAFSALREQKTRVLFFRTIPDTLMQPIGIFFIMTIFAISYKTQGFNIAAFAAVVYLIQRIFVYLQQLQNHMNVIGECLPFFEEMLKAEASAKVHEEKDHGIIEPSFVEDIYFADVQFSYEEGTPVVDGLSFKLHRGKTTGLIGPSGSGKTTIADLLLRLFSPRKGIITLGRADIGSFAREAWRKKVGYVSQDIFLMNDTIENNIRFYDDSLSEEDINEAVRLANLTSVVEKCPLGLMTVIGERGVHLSAGQRQRIVIARVLARKPEFLILDEATSALDNESEAEIQRVLEDIKGKMTVLVIAHRLLTVMSAHHLLVLEKGKILEEGNPKELLEKEGSYFMKVYNMRK